MCADPHLNRRVSIGFSSIVLITGIYRMGLQVFMKAKSDEEKEQKIKGDGENDSSSSLT